MTIGRIFLGVAILAALVLAVRTARDPHRARLPVGSTDLSAKRAVLDRLDEEERALLLAYVVRSRGDVLPAKFADPDEPLTARTFGQAIELQRRFDAARGVGDKQLAALRSARTAALAPLRAVLTVELLRRERLPRSQLFAPPGPDARGAIAGVPANEPPVLVTTYRIRNRSPKDIAAFTAGVHVHRADTEFSYLGSLAECWIDQREPLDSGASVDVRCGGGPGSRGASSDEAYLRMPAADLALEWIPKTIEFAHAPKLEYRGD